MSAFSSCRLAQSSYLVSLTIAHWLHLNPPLAFSAHTGRVISEILQGSLPQLGSHGSSLPSTSRLTLEDLLVRRTGSSIYSCNRECSQTPHRSTLAPSTCMCALEPSYGPTDNNADTRGYVM
jgi:hypothetical protein